MDWRPEDLSSVFVDGPEASETEGTGTLIVYRHAGRSLRYEIWLLPDINYVSVSGDTDRPFGSDSLYEIYIPCDDIASFADPYHSGLVALGFWFGKPRDSAHLRMYIMRRADGDLKVWPVSFLPPEHPFHYSAT